MLTRTRRGGPIAPDQGRRPRLADAVIVHPPVAGSTDWFLQRGASRYFRVGRDVATVASALDGRRDCAQLAADLAAPWSASSVSTVVARLEQAGMLDDGTARSRRHDRRLRFVPPLTVQVALLHPGRALAFLSPAVRFALSRAGAALAAILGVLGAASLIAHGPELVGALTSPQSLTTYLLVFAGVLATTAAHELAHGAVLTHFGGRPSRLGVMLFYLTPAFFCDVSDGWRLPGRGQRVRVALAGIVVQGLAASVASAAAWVAGADSRPGLLLFAVATGLAGLLNLVPLIKLDGYIALMTHLDIPHLRDRAMLDGRRMLARVLFGGRYPRELPDRAWAPAFGLASMAFPIYVVLGALVLWVDTFLGLGWVGAVLVCLVGLAVVRFVVRGWWRLVAQARAAGARVTRIVAVSLATIVAAAAVLTVATVPVRADGGYLRDADGSIEFVTSRPLTGIDAGSVVTLYRAGLGGRVQIGTGLLGSASGVAGDAPIGALLPVDGLSLQMPAWRYPVADVTVTGGSVTGGPALDGSSGAASVTGGDLPLWRWLAEVYLLPALHW